MEASATVTRQQPKEHTLVHFEIPASDPSKIARFYEQLFGWKFTKWEGGTMDYWLISHKDATTPDDTLGGLYKRNTPQEQFLNYFLVNNIDQSVTKATGLGAKVTMAKQEIPNIGWFAVLADPDGNTFALYQSKGRM
jgi:predicted enzyme related to lactoylglutathione lyase